MDDWEKPININNLNNNNCSPVAVAPPQDPPQDPASQVPWLQLSPLNSLLATPYNDWRTQMNGLWIFLDISHSKPQYQIVYGVFDGLMSLLIGAIIRVHDCSL